MNQTKCPNCDKPLSVIHADEKRCYECDWPIDKPVDRSVPLCSICRRRHGNEVQHECE